MLLKTLYLRLLFLWFASLSNDLPKTTVDGKNDWTLKYFNFPQAHFSMVAMLPGCDKYMKEIHTINQLCSEVAIATKQWKRRRKWKQVHISITNIEYILLYVVWINCL